MLTQWHSGNKFLEIIFEINRLINCGAIARFTVSN